MTQVKIAKKILEQGSCHGISCSKECGFAEHKNGVLRKCNAVDLNWIRQWLKEQEKEMIDLTVNQIVDPSIRCWVRDDEDTEWFEKELIAVYDGMVMAREKRPGFSPHGWKHCTLTDPTKPKFKPWLKVEDVPVELCLTIGEKKLKYKLTEE